VNACTAGGETLHPLKTSEGKAHVEVAQKYGVRFRCVAGSCLHPRVHVGGRRYWGAVFVVDALGEKPDYGFDWSDEEVEHFKSSSPLCQRVHADQRKALSFTA